MSTPKIEYPCEWSFTIIGADEGALREAAAQVFAGKDFSLKFSNKSKGGKYTSLNITTNVASEEERNVLFRKLCGHPAIKIVI